MAQILKISDGTTTVDFMATPDVYRLISWVPGVATRKVGMMGGRGAYGDVIEDMTISITAADPLPYLETLMRLFDQAQRWALGEPVAAVLLHYKVTSGSEELKAAILGAAGDGAAMVELPPRFMLSQVTTVLNDVRLIFRRSGLWLGAEETVTSTSAANGVVMATGLFTAASEIESPVRLGMHATLDDVRDVANSYFLMTGAPTAADAAKRLVVVNAEDLHSPDFYTSTTDTANKALTGNILRFQDDYITPGGWATSAIKDISAVTLSSVRRWAIFINWRNNSATTSFRVRFQFYMGAAVTELPPSQALDIPAGVSDPQWSFVATVSLPRIGVWTEFFMEAQGSDTTGTLDIDSIVFMAADSPTTDCVVGVLPDQISDTITGAVYISGHPLTYPVGSVYLDATSEDIPLAYSGDPALFIAPGARSIAACWLTTNDNYWRAVRDSDSATLFASFSATRRRGYLIPR